MLAADVSPDMRAARRMLKAGPALKAGSGTCRIGAFETPRGMP
jgi:hypothetical protein